MALRNDNWVLSKSLFCFFYCFHLQLRVIIYHILISIISVFAIYSYITCVKMSKHIYVPLFFGISGVCVHRYNVDKITVTDIAAHTLIVVNLLLFCKRIIWYFLSIMNFISELFSATKRNYSKLVKISNNEIIIHDRIICTYVIDCIMFVWFGSIYTITD